MGEIDNVLHPSEVYKKFLHVLGLNKFVRNWSRILDKMFDILKLTHI